MRALGWCPGLAVLCLQFQRLISYKQPKRIVPMLECNSCVLLEVNAMDENRSEALHYLGRG